MIAGYICEMAAWWIEGNKVMFLDKKRNLLLESTNKHDIDQAKTILKDIKQTA